MPTVGFGRLNADATHEELVERVAKMEKTLEYLFGGLDTKNIREISGWKVNPNELVSRDGDVGMSTEDTAADDVRFFAGAPGGSKEVAPWRVTKSGKEYSTGAHIQSTSGYPKVEIDPDDNLFAAYSNALDSIRILSSYSSGPPALAFYQNDDVVGVLHTTTYDGGSILFITLPSKHLEISAGRELQLSAGNRVTVPNWSNFANKSTGETLQQALNSLNDAINGLTSQIAGKATSGASTGSNGLHNHGIPDGTQLMTADGGAVTFHSSGSHSHTQT